MNHPSKRWRNLNLIFFVIGILSGVFLYNFHPFHDFLLSLGALEYVGAFVAGVLYDSTITVSTSVVILLVLAEELSVLEIGVVAGIGAVLGDVLIFKFIKSRFSESLNPFAGFNEFGFEKKRLKTLKHMIHTKYFNWMLPLIAAVLIGSPFPNELAWGLMGLTKIKTYQVLLISFVFNFVGIVLILLASTVAKP